MKERISKLKAQLIAQHPFFGIFLSNTDVIEENIYPTAATDGIRIYYNADFFSKLTDPEAKAILLHEVLHMVYSHCDKKRRGLRDIKTWNYAVDYAINWEIKAMNKEHVSLPKDIIINGEVRNMLYDPKYKDMYAEDIYDALDGKICNEEGFDIHIDKDLDEAEQQELEDKILTSYELVKNEKGANMSSGIMRTVDEIKKTRAPWTRLLHRYIGNALGKDDYSYNTFNRRFLSQDIYLPGLRNHKLDCLAIVIDTSASIKPRELGAMKNELRKISALVSNVIVISCDDKVHSFETITDMMNFDKAISAIKGKGATDFRPPFIELKNRKIRPQVVIYMTDGYGTYPQKKDVPYPVIWVMTNKNVAPFGATVQIMI